MKTLDFISKSPNFYIFKEGANKTHLGGFLFLVYIIIIVLLAIVYFYDYFSNNKYKFTYSLDQINNETSFLENEQIQSMISKEFNIIAYLAKDGPNNHLIDNNNFIVVDFYKLNRKIKLEKKSILNSTEDSNNDECIIKQDEPFKHNIKNLQLGVLYRCDKDNCTIRPDDKINVRSYYLNFYYQGFSIKHQDPKIPIQQLPDNWFNYEPLEFLENTNIIYLNWEIIEYREEKGIFGKTIDKTLGNNNTYYGGYYKKKDTFTDDGHVKKFPQTYLNDIRDLHGNRFIMLLYMESKVTENEYEIYTRKAASVLDIIASIASLSSTALNLMGLVYGILYHGNYDNYKIIENILTKKMKVNINKKPPDENDSEKVKIELKSDLIEKESTENDKINENEPELDNVEENGENIKSTYLNLTIPKFFHFLFHLFYCKCCKRSSDHILINSCNNIVAKYLTIENVLYNQMKLESFWKDYKWNNSQNKIKYKEDLLLDLKEK